MIDDGEDGEDDEDGDDDGSSAPAAFWNPSSRIRMR